MKRYWILLILLCGSLGGFVSGPAIQAQEHQDSTVQEAIRYQQQIAQGTSAVDPLTMPSPTAPGSALGGNPMTGMSPESMMKLLELMRSKPFQKYIQLATNPTFVEGVQELVNHPNRMKLLYAEIGLFLFMIVFRAWRSSKVESWLGRLWLQLWTFVVTCALGTVALPMMILGPGYLKTIELAYRTLTQ